MPGFHATTSGRVSGAAEVFFAPQGNASERRTLMGWLKDRANDSDSPTCAWHEHINGQPCNDACHKVGGA